jgi:hypothetical protein
MSPGCAARRLARRGRQPNFHSAGQGKTMRSAHWLRMPQIALVLAGPPGYTAATRRTVRRAPSRLMGKPTRQQNQKLMQTRPGAFPWRVSELVPKGDGNRVGMTWCGACRRATRPPGPKAWGTGQPPPVRPRLVAHVPCARLAPVGVRQRECVRHNTGPANLPHELGLSRSCDWKS